MIRSFVEGLLGPLGRQLLYFYEANSLTLNLIVVSYGLIMLMSWTTLVRLYRHLVVLTARRIHEHPDLTRKSTVKSVREAISIPWEEVVDATPFPLIARLGALIPRRKSVKTLQEMLDERELIRHALALLKGENIRRIMPRYRIHPRLGRPEPDDDDTSENATEDTTGSDSA
jgi:hypothetical protein